MGQFKPMVKMFTTEPSVELKLKKGGHVAMKKGGSTEGHQPMAKMMDGGLPPAMPARGGMTTGAAPLRPSMAARRRAMTVAPMARAMKEGGETPSMHKAEMTKMGKLEKELKSHEGKPASKAHKGLKTGGVVMGQAGFKKGGSVESGIIKSNFNEKTTKMETAEGEHHTPKSTGEVVMGKPGGYKHGGKAMKKFAKGGGVEGNVSTTPPGVTNTTTGEVKKGNAGGFKKGGAAKKAFATGGSVNDSGHPVAYPKKPASQSVKNNLQSGTFKRGGKVKMNKGGEIPAEAMSAIKQADAERAFRDYEKSETAENKAMRDSILGAPGRMLDSIKGLFGSKPPAGSVTKTKESVTVAKKRGGKVKC